MLFLHHDIHTIEMNGGKRHYGSLRYPSNMNFIKSQLLILVLVLIILILASHFPSPAQGVVVVVTELQLKVLLQHKNNNNFKILDAKKTALLLQTINTKMVMISKEKNIWRYVNKTQHVCYKSLETSSRKFVKLLGITTAVVVVIIGSEYFFVT